MSSTRARTTRASSARVVAVCCQASAAASASGTQGRTSVRPCSTSARASGHCHRTPSRTTRTPSGGPPHERASPTRTSQSRTARRRVPARPSRRRRGVCRGRRPRPGPRRAAGGCRPRRWRSAGPPRRCPAPTGRHARRRGRGGPSCRRRPRRAGTGRRRPPRGPGPARARRSAPPRRPPCAPHAGGPHTPPRRRPGPARSDRWAGSSPRRVALRDQLRRPPGSGRAARVPDDPRCGGRQGRPSPPRPRPGGCRARRGGGGRSPRRAVAALPGRAEPRGHADGRRGALSPARGPPDGVDGTGPTFVPGS